MKVCRESNAQWFEAVIEGDLEFVQNNMHQCTGESDDRPVDFAPKVIANFTALMYAIYYNRLSIVELLFEHEYNVATRGPTRVYAPSTRQTILLAAGSNVFHVILLTQNSEILEYMIQELRDSFYQQYFVGRSNGFKQTISHFAFLNYSFAAASICYSDELFEPEFAMLDKTNSTPLMLACYIGKHVYAMKARNLLSALHTDGNTAQLRKLCANIFRKNNMGMDIFGVCQLEVDERLKGSVEYGGKGRCCEIIEEIEEWYEEILQRKRGTLFNKQQPEEQDDADAQTAQNLAYQPYEMQEAPNNDLRMSTTHQNYPAARSTALNASEPPFSYDQLTQSELAPSRE